MPKVRFIRNTTFEGKTYERGSEHDVSDKTAKALGSVVEVLGKTEKKEVEKAPKDKMVKGAKTK